MRPPTLRQSPDTIPEEWPCTCTATHHFYMHQGVKQSWGYHYLSEPSAYPKKPSHKPPLLNVTIHMECTTMKNVLASAMEEKLGALFLNCQWGAALRISLEEMVHRQPPKPVVADSATIKGFVNNNIRQIKSKSIDMIQRWSITVRTRGSSVSVVTPSHSPLNPKTQCFIAFDPMIIPYPQEHFATWKHSNTRLTKQWT